jgi:hypothetical protein
MSLTCKGLTNYRLGARTFLEYSGRLLVQLVVSGESSLYGNIAC